MTADGISVADFSALGTQIRVAVADGGALCSARAAVEEVLREIDRACSRFRDDSELMRVNRAHGDWVVVSPLFADALAVAVHAARLTHGLVDPTVGGAMVSLGYDRTFSELPGDGPPIDDPPRPCPGWWTIEFDAAASALRVPPGTQLDFGSTGKALASDRAAQRAGEAAGTGVLVSCGGDIAVSGQSPGDGWVIRVTEDEHGAIDGGGQSIYLDSGGMATSGTRTRRWRRGGAEQHHIVNPSTGRPIDEYWRTVTVVAATCTDANTASTAALILGKAAPQWLNARRLPSRLVRRDGAVTTVDQWPRQEERRTA